MGWQLRHTSNAYNRTCRWSKCDSRHVVYCLSGGRKGHAEVLIKSVAENSCGAEVSDPVAHQRAVGVVAALLEKLQLGF